MTLTPRSSRFFAFAGFRARTATSVAGTVFRSASTVRPPRLPVAPVTRYLGIYRITFRSNSRVLLLDRSDGLEVRCPHGFLGAGWFASKQLLQIGPKWLPFASVHALDPPDGEFAYKVGEASRLGRLRERLFGNLIVGNGFAG